MHTTGSTTIEPMADEDIPFAEMDIPLAQDASDVDEAPRSTGDRTPPAAGPRLAVVLTARDRTDALIATVESVWRQSALPHELIIIDDGQLSPEAWESIAVRCTALGIDWKYDVNDPPGPICARNRAARLADSELLLYLEDDVNLGDGCLAELRRIMADGQVAGASATVEKPPAAGRLRRLFLRGGSAAAEGASDARGRPAENAASAGAGELGAAGIWQGGAATVCRRDVVLERPFDESLADDVAAAEREWGRGLVGSHRLLEAASARITLRREHESQEDRRRRGYTNALGRLRSATLPGRGGMERARAHWELLIGAARHVGRAIAENRPAHLAEARGMVEGALAWRRRARQERRQRVRAARRRAIDLARSARSGAIPMAEDAREVSALFVIDGRGQNGAGEFVRETIRRLPEHGIRPVVVCAGRGSDGADAWRRQGIESHSQIAAEKGGAGAALRLGRWCQMRGIDAVVVAADDTGEALTSIAAGRWSRAAVAVWPPLRSEARRQDLGLACRLVFRGADVILAADAAQKRALAAGEKLPAGRIVALAPSVIAGARSVEPVPAEPGDAGEAGMDAAAASMARSIRSIVAGRRARDWRKAMHALRRAAVSDIPTTSRGG